MPSSALSRLALVVAAAVLVLAPMQVSLGAPQPTHAWASAPDECGRELPGGPAVYLGAWVPAALDDARLPLERDPLGRFEALAAKQLTIVNRWEHWGLGSGGRIDLGWLDRVARAGAVPMVTWVPWNPDINPPDFQQGFLPRDIASGAHDRYIEAVASDVAMWDGPLFIRLAQEMNGTWYPWGKHQNSPAEFIGAWRHVHQIFEATGAGHVTWVWNPSEKNHPESMGLWYPGDDVVDWVAVDGYNWDDSNYWRDSGDNTWRSLEQVFGSSFADIDSFVPADKPWMIAEVATTERRNDPGMKAAWICDSFRRALPASFPRVKAVLWFHEQKSEADRPFFWPIDTTESSREAFAAAVAPEYYARDLGDLRHRIGHNKVPPPEQLP